MSFLVRFFWFFILLLGFSSTEAAVNKSRHRSYHEAQRSKCTPKTLSPLLPYKPVIVLDDITTMKYEGDFKDVKKSLDGPIKLFTETICKYGMYDEMKRVFGDRVKKLDNDPDKKKLLLNNLNSII